MARGDTYEDDEDEKPKKKKKKSRRDDDEDDTPKPKANVYTGLTALTFLGLVIAAVFFYLDFDERSATDKKLPEPTVSIGALLPVAKGPGPVRP
jgi:hypothetical protein